MLITPIVNLHLGSYKYYSKEYGINREKGIFQIRVGHEGIYIKRVSIINGPSGKYQINYKNVTSEEIDKFLLYVFQKGDPQKITEKKFQSMEKFFRSKMIEVLREWYPEIKPDGTTE